MSKVIKACFVVNDSCKTQNSTYLGEQHNIPQSSHPAFDSVESIYHEAKLMVEELLALAQKKADETILKAREEGQAIIEEGKRASEQVYDKAYDQGFTKGYEEGRQKGARELDSQYRDVVKLFHGFEEEKNRILVNQENDIVELIITLTKKIVGKLLDIKPEMIFQVVKQALKAAGDSDKVTIKVNPIHVSHLNGYCNDSSELSPDSFAIIEDANIAPGDCLILTDNGYIEAKIDEQLSLLKDALLEEVGNAAI